MLISDLLEGVETCPVVVIGPDTPVMEAASRLDDCDSSALVVMAGSAVLGVFAESDLVRAIVRNGLGIALMTVAEVIDRRLVTCSMADPVTEALDRMSMASVRHVPVVEDGRPVTILTIREFELACRHLAAQAGTDELTGLGNRRSFLRAVEAELNRHQRYGAPLAVAMMDIDMFKTINDCLGHAEGDRLLRVVATTLSGTVRSCDKVARIGGDEFAVLFPETPLREAVQACGRLSRACAAIRFPRIEGVSGIGLSFGVAAAVADDGTPQSILKRADESLYDAKKAERLRMNAATRLAGRQLQTV